ncbi:hypothetical protein BaRGS_00026895 [Batillaria attramentaria]|uniref:Uncharacterized protein n=1 Tax=Batillaria attramentaria TaxID=370345 RepID=A0ABD0K3P9_9CAEN
MTLGCGGNQRFSPLDLAEMIPGFRHMPTRQENISDLQKRWGRFYLRDKVEVTAVTLKLVLLLFSVENPWSACCPSATDVLFAVQNTQCRKNPARSFEGRPDGQLMAVSVGDLLKNTADFLDTLLDLSDDLCSGWASTDLVDALLEAIQQIGYKHSETLEVFLHIFQLLSTSQEGVQALVERGEEVLMPLLQYLECVCQDEIVGLEEHSACLSSVFSLLNALFMSDSAIVEKLSTSAHLLRCMLKVLEPLYPIVHHVDVNSTTNQSVKATGISTAAPSQESATTDPTSLSKSQDKETGTDSKSRREKSQGERMDEQGDAEDVKEVTKAEGAECGDSGRAEVKDMSEIDAEEMRQFQTLFDVLQAFLRDFIWSLQVDQNEQEGSGDESSTASNVPLFLPALKYLDSACSRCRINYLALTIAKPNATTDSVKTATTTTDNTSKPAGSSAAAESQDKSASTDSPVQVTLSGDLSLVLHLKQLCLTFGQTRVARILDDVMSGRVVKRAESTVL